MHKLRQVSLGSTDLQISAIGYGAMHLAYESEGVARDAEEVLRTVISSGVTLIDTSDRYCNDERDAHSSERQIASALRTHAEDASSVCVATKGGMLFPDGKWVRYGKPDHIRETIQQSYLALGGEQPITLWQYHQLDLNYPLEETLGAVQEAVDEGLVHHVGVSNFSVEQLARARQVLDVVSIQNEYSLWWRGPERDGVLDYCEREGITFLAWRPLGGKHRASRLMQNQRIATLAKEKEVSPSQLALAWLMAKSSRVVPIPGSTNPQHIADAVASTQLTLDQRDLKLLEDAVDEEPPSLRLTT